MVIKNIGLFFSYHNYNEMFGSMLNNYFLLYFSKKIAPKMPLRIAIIIISSFFCIGISNAQNNSYRFKHLTYEDGLTNSNIYTFCQDSKGFMWIGTEGGLFRYDGLEFKVYKNIISDSTSINSQAVFTLFKDSKNRIWVGTYQGLMLYNEEKDNFIDFYISDIFKVNDATAVNQIIEIPGSGILVGTAFGALLFDSETLELDQKFSKRFSQIFDESTILSLFQSSDGLLWVGTTNGLFSWDISTRKPHKYNLYELSGIQESNIVVNIYEDSYDDIWIATRGGGIFRRVKTNDTFISYEYNAFNNNSLGSNECYWFYEDENNRLWISTNGSGINFFNRENNNFSYLKHEPGDKFGLLNNNTRTIYKDMQGNLWICSFQAGLNLLINNPYQFKQGGFITLTKSGSENTSVISFLLENKNTLWIGTDGGGLKKVHRETSEVVSFTPQDKNGFTFPDKVVMNIHKDDEGYLWMGTYLEGLIQFDPETYNYRQFKNNPTDPNSISHNYVSVIHEDTRGNLWVGTNGGGLNLFDQTTEKFTSYKSDPKHPNTKLINNYINVIEEDFNGDLWIGTYWGLSRFNVQNSSFQNHSVNQEYPNGLNSNVIYCLLNDSKNRLWIGTRSGLLRYNFQTNKFIHYSQIDGVGSNQINGLLEDNNGILWISTDNGIVKLNPDTKESQRFFEEDGLQGNEFFHNASHKGFNDELFFGGYKGYNSFFADSIIERNFIPDVILTKLKVLDKEIVIDETYNKRIILDENITETDSIYLRYSDKTFSLGFAAIDFVEGNKLNYAYKLQGFDNEWHYTNSSLPVATYTNLSPGEYNLRIKAGKKNLIDNINKERTVYIQIDPPFWRKWWAYLTYLIFVIGIILFFWLLSIRRLKAKNTIKLEKLKRENAEAVNQARIRFFTNISHEIRTPLTLIIGPLEQLIARGEETKPFRKHFDIMLKNARRLLRLINQLLDFRKIELDKMNLIAEYGNFTKFIQEINYSFEELAANKNIKFVFKSGNSDIYLWFDPDKMDKIVFNLLSNAFKYTPEKGTITVSLTPDVSLEDRGCKFVELKVSDNGKGINQEDLKNIFDRFYQGDQGGTTQQGWGLGLALTHSFVKIHQGELIVDSAKDVGTHFKAYFPQGDKHLSEHQKSIDSYQTKVNKYIHISTDPYIDIMPDSANHNSIFNHSKPQMIIVEDSTELRDYLVSELSSHYNCMEAKNGREGLEKAIEMMPDIVISDIMMPEMDGTELCHEIKSNIITSHIPVILLTAKSQVEDQIQGFESGADAYIPKPFNIENLKANIKSILLNRQRIKDRFSAFALGTSSKKPVNADNKFIVLVDEKVIKNLDNPSFGVEELAKELNMSRTHLLRKMKAISNIGPNDYIKKVRMQKATELLLDGEKNITEVSEAVGFNSTSYFSSAFKSFYKISPKEFINRNKQN